MLGLMRKLILFASLLALTFQYNNFAQSSSLELIAKLDSSLTVLVNIQTRIQDIHPCLKDCYSVAFPYNDSLLIFDYDSTISSYKFIKETAQPFPLPEGIQASFPLSVYDNKPTCIITPKIFSTTAGYATVMHEFIHCCQYNTVEPGIKKTLEINKIAMENKDYSWEIDHPFPYNDSVFINFYDNYKQALEENDIGKAKIFRARLKEHLDKIDFEYMLWEEWKEGLARYVENKINKRLNIDPNNYGKNKPYNRVCFYYSGELLITRLTEADPELPSDMKSFFEKIRDF
jgi:hypothetical protein